MRYPEFLKKNGCIGFVAPSFGCNIEPYKTAFGHALDKFEKMGYRTELGPNCYEGCGIGISNTPETEMVSGIFGQYEHDIFTDHTL